MKTAISVPDETFERATRRAGDLGMSRSEFFAVAAQRYLDELDAQSLTGQIDSALEHLGAPDEVSADAVAAGHHVLHRGRRVVIHHSEIYWADLGFVSGRQPARRRPVLVIQSDP